MRGCVKIGEKDFMEKGGSERGEGVNTGEMRSISKRPEASIEMPEGSKPYLVPAVRVGLSPPQPPIKAVLGKVSQHRHRDRLLQSTVAAEKAAKLVHQVSQHTWHTTRVYRRYTEHLHTNTWQATPSTQAGRHTPL